MNPNTLPRVANLLSGINLHDRVTRRVDVHETLIPSGGSVHVLDGTVSRIGPRPEVEVVEEGRTGPCLDELPVRSGGGAGRSGRGAG